MALLLFINLFIIYLKSVKYDFLKINIYISALGLYKFMQN